MVCSAGIPSYSTYSIYFTSHHNLHLHTVPTYILNRTTHSSHFGIRISADASACASANASWRMRSPESATTVSSSGPSASAWLGVDHDGILLGAWLEVVEILPDFCQEERVILLVTDPESGLSACLWSYDPHVQHPCSGHSAFLWSREPHVQHLRSGREHFLPRTCRHSLPWTWGHLLPRTCGQLQTYIYIATSIPVFEVAPYACTMRRLVTESAPGCATRLSAYLRNVLGESIACARKLIEKLGVFV